MSCDSTASHGPRSTLRPRRLSQPARLGRCCSSRRPNASANDLAGDRRRCASTKDASRERPDSRHSKHRSEPACHNAGSIRPPHAKHRARLSARASPRVQLATAAVPFHFAAPLHPGYVDRGSRAIPRSRGSARTSKSYRRNEDAHEDASHEISQPERGCHPYSEMDGILPLSFSAITTPLRSGIRLWSLSAWSSLRRTSVVFVPAGRVS